MLEAFSVSKFFSGSDYLQVRLTFAERQKSRHKTRTECGQELGWFIERGQILADGDFLLVQPEIAVKVLAAPEAVSQVQADDLFLLMRAAYHLGNRHVPLQIGSNFLRYLQDHVLDAMVAGFGLEVQHQALPFQPENGAYHGKSILHIHHGHSHTGHHSH